MKYLFLLFSIMSSFASTELKVGDILLQPLHCYACNLIEAQTKSEYSHVGVVISVEKRQFLIAEAFQKVRVVTFKEFTSKTQNNLKIEILRPYFVSADLYANYLMSFHDKPYDSKFTWSDEGIYCSELIQKLFHQSNMLTPNPRAMLFDINPEAWDRHFRGSTPRGKLGISPENFKESKLFEEIGFYED